MTAFLTRILGFTLLLTLLHSPTVTASYATHDAARRFAAEMADRHGFDPTELLATLGQASHDERVIRLIRPPSRPGTRSWQDYRGRFLGDARVKGGVSFWRRYQQALHAASEQYGVPPEVIVAIVGVETHYGSYTGSFEAVSALATLAFDYPPRADLFRRELENLFLLAREQGRDPFSYRGSFAGALGYPQFLPSSIRNYAVDFDGDGKIDFDTDAIDAIGSIANYLAVHGWQSREPVAVEVSLPADLDPAPLIAAGIEPSLDHLLVMSTGISARNGQLHPAQATLFDLPTPGARTEYWLGYRNFYVITRYNRSSFYAMAVYQLADAIRLEYRRLEEAMR